MTILTEGLQPREESYALRLFFTSCLSSQRLDSSILSASATILTELPLTQTLSSFVIFVRADLTHGSPTPTRVAHLPYNLSEGLISGKSSTSGLSSPLYDSRGNQRHRAHGQLSFTPTRSTSTNRLCPSSIVPSRAKKVVWPNAHVAITRRRRIHLSRSLPNRRSIPPSCPQNGLCPTSIGILLARPGSQSTSQYR